MREKGRLEIMGYLRGHKPPHLKTRSKKNVKKTTKTKKKRNYEPSTGY